MNRHAKPELGLQVGEQVQHPGLHRDVQGAGRLVGDEQLGVQDERPGQARALPLTARELVREAVAERLGQLDGLQQLVDPRPGLGGVRRQPVHDQRLGDALRRW